MHAKDYVAIAGAVARSRMAMDIGRKKRTAQEGIALVATDLATTLATDNPRFDRARFIAACGCGQ